VQALMNEVLAKQLDRREEGVKEGTGIGKKITASLEALWCFRGGRLSRWRVAGLGRSQRGRRR
jgi:hypothetical protein